MSGPRRAGRSASRPAPNFTTDAANSAAPSRAPSACGPAPSTPVTNARSSGEIISLAKSLSSETAPNSFTGRGSRAAGAASLPLMQTQAPPDQRDGQAAVLEDRIVEAAQRERRPARRAKVLAQLQ